MVTNQRYIASNKNMKKGYWQIIDTKTGYAVESGFTSKKYAEERAKSYDHHSKTSWR